MADAKIEVKTVGDDAGTKTVRLWAIIIGSAALAIVLILFVLQLDLEDNKTVVAVLVITVGVLVAWSGVVLVILTAHPKAPQVEATTDDSTVLTVKDIAAVIEALSKLTPAVAVMVVGGLVIGMGLWFW